jgi:TolA-binding protein
MTRLVANTFFVLAFSAATLSAANSASAQESAADSDSPFSVFHRLFGDKERTAPPQDSQRVAQASPADLVVRIDRLEAQIRQLTGTIEQLQFRNQQLEAQLRQSTAPQPPAVQMRQPLSALWRRRLRRSSRTDAVPDAFDPNTKSKRAWQSADPWHAFQWRTSVGKSCTGL